MALHAALLISWASSRMRTGALTWFETVWSYGVEAIDYGIILSISMKQGSLFCFVTLRSPKSQHFMLHYWYLQKALDE
jgi:hypothetical protein